MTARLSVRVQPRARVTALAGWMADGTLKLKVCEPPEDGRANQAVVEHLAEVAGVRRGAVRVVRGAASRIKVVEVDGLDDDELRSRISAALGAVEGNDGG